MPDARHFDGISPDAIGVKGSFEARPRAFALAMFAILLASYAINAMDRQLFSLLASDVRREYGFSLSQSGLLSTIFTLGMALAGLPTGYLLVRFTRKTTVQIGIAIFSIGTALTALAHGFADMLLYRAATGIGEAMQLTALLAAASGYFTRHRAAAAGSINFAYAIGAIVGPVLTASLLSAWKTWRAPMLIFGLLGIVAIAVIALTVRPWLTELTGEFGNRTGGAAGALTLLNRNSLILTAMSLIGGMIVYGYLGMYPTYLREHLAYSPAAAGTVMSIYGFGALASIGGGWLGDRFSPRLVMSATFLVAAVLGYLLFHGSPLFATQAALSFAWGVVVSGSIYVNLAGYHMKSVRSDLVSSASGLFVASLYGSAAFAGYSIGWLASHAGWVTAGLIQISLLSIVGAALAAFLQADRMALGSREG
jgi:DHA1 family inner membrane transport protein